MSDKLEDIVEGLGGEIIFVGTSVKTVLQTAAALGIKPKQVIKSLLVITKGEGPVLAILDGESRLDLRKLSEKFGYTRLATPEEVKKIAEYQKAEITKIRGVDSKKIIRFDLAAIIKGPRHRRDPV